MTHETESLFDQTGESMARATREQRAKREAVFGRYIEILWRSDSPEQNDSRELADLLAQLGIGPEQARQDLERIRKIVHLRQLHEGRQGAQQRVIAARAAVKSLRERHEKENDAAFMTMHRAECEFDRTFHALVKAQAHRDQRHQLFLSGGGPADFPRLCFEPAAAEAETTDAVPDHPRAQPQD